MKKNLMFDETFALFPNDSIAGHVDSLDCIT